MSIWQILRRARDRYPDRIAVVSADGSREVCYRELHERTLARAAEWQASGVGPGDRVAVLEFNRQSYLESYFAAAALGAILVSLNTRLSQSELRDILADSGTKLVVVGEGLAIEQSALPCLPADSPGLEAHGFVPVDNAEADVAQLYYTSGTTGRPKGVMLTHGNVGTHALAAVAELGLVETDTWAHIAPMFHLADAWAVFAITWVGGRHVLLDRFEASAALQLLSEREVSITNLVPTMLNQMVRDPLARELEYPGLRMMLSGGAPIAAALVSRVLSVFQCEYVQTYGMTETSPYLTLSLLSDKLRELPRAEQLVYVCKTGRPFQGVELRVVDEMGDPVVADGQAIGEILVRGPTVTPGYWHQPGATAEAIRDGWLHTGDLATLDAEGFVDIVDRKKDVILTGGEIVYSIEVENVLFQLEGIREAAVFGRPDEEWGEVVCAALVCSIPLDGEAVRAHCARHLANFKIPRLIEFLEALPRTGSGKIAKRLIEMPDSLS